MKNKLKIHQKTLTQACQILPKKAFFDTFSNSRLSKILKILSEKSALRPVFGTKKISLFLIKKGREGSWTPVLYSPKLEPSDPFLGVEKFSVFLSQKRKRGKLDSGVT